MFLYLLPAQQSLTTGVSRAVMKQKGLFLSFLENLADTKRKFYDVAHFSSLHFSLFMTLSTFYDYVRARSFGINPN